MTEYKVETLADCLEEIKVLFKEHWDEVADPLIPLNPDYIDYPVGKNAKIFLTKACSNLIDIYVH